MCLKSMKHNAKEEVRKRAVRTYRRNQPEYPALTAAQQLKTSSSAVKCATLE